MRGYRVCRESQLGSGLSMEDYASDNVFSDQEEIVDREEGSDAVIGEMIGEKAAVPSPETDGGTIPRD